MNVLTKIINATRYALLRHESDATATLVATAGNEISWSSGRWMSAMEVLEYMIGIARWSALRGLGCIWKVISRIPFVPIYKTETYIYKYIEEDMKDCYHNAVSRAQKMIHVVCSSKSRFRILLGGTKSRIHYHKNREFCHGNRMIEDSPYIFLTPRRTRRFVLKRNSEGCYRAGLMSL